MKARKLIVLWLVPVVLMTGVTACKPVSPKTDSEKVSGFGTASQTPLSISTSVPQPELTQRPAQAPVWAGEALPNFPGFTEALDIEVDHAGGLHVVWGTDAGDGQGSYRIFYSMKDPGISSPWSEPVEIFGDDSPSDSWAVNISLAIDSRNIAHVIWSTGKSIFHTSQENDGSWLLPAAINPATCHNCSPGPPGIAIDKEDQIHVVWADFGSDKIYWSSKPLMGEWSAVMEISPKASFADQSLRAEGRVSLEVDGNSTLHITWNTFDTIMYTLKPRDGSWSTPANISGGSSVDGSPVMEIDSANTVHIVWIDNSPRGIDAEFLYTNRLSDGTWIKPKAIPDATVKQPDSYTLALVGDDDLILMWKGANIGDYYPISFFTKLAGEFWSESTSIPETDGENLYALTGDPSGSVHFVWDNWDTGELVYAEESFTDIAQPPIAIADITPLPGLVEFTIVTGPGERRDPAISGNVIVWSEKGEQDWDIFGYDLSTQFEFPIITREGDQLAPAISGNIVVWEDQRADLPRIYAYDLRTGQEYPVTDQSSPQWQPDISGEIVVFKDWRKTGQCSWGGGFFTSTSCDWDIWGANLETHAEFPISIDQNVQNLPRVSGNNVIWAQWQDDPDSAVYTNQIDSASPPVQLDTIDGNSRPALDGNIMVWNTWQGLFGYHFLTGDKFPVAIGIGWTDEPDISGNIVVWADGRNGDADIYGYDLTTGQEFPICTAPGDQVNPTIHGDIVVWVDERNFLTEIYAAQLPSMNDKQTESVVPALTLTPTPAPTPTPTPLTPPVPILLSPANNSVVDTLLPVYRFDLGMFDPNLDLLMGSSMSGEGAQGIGYCPQEQGSSLVECAGEDNLQPGTIYTWQVLVWYQECSGSIQDCEVYSEEWSFTTPSKPISQAAPTLRSPVGGIMVDPDSVMLQWNPVEGAILYQVGWGDYGPGHYFVMTERETPEPISEALEPGTTYYWGVRARDDYAWSDWAEATFTTSP